MKTLLCEVVAMVCSKLYRGQKDLDAVDRNLYCLTAVMLEGRVLWQDGKPYDRSFPFTSHGTQGGCLMPCVDDVDGDGQPKVIVIRHGELVLLEAATGKTKAHVRLPADNFVDVSTAQLGPREKGRQIICKVNDRSYKPWPYANPIVVYNADLSVYHEPFAVRGAGHNWVARDVASMIVLASTAWRPPRSAITMPHGLPAASRNTSVT